MPDIAVVEQKVYQLIAEQLDIDLDEIKDSSSIVMDLDADSLDVVELVISLEENFHIEIPDADAEKLLTVGDVIKYVASR